ncbi:hypothetical protein B0T17DRAFT_495230 [Bombardia bombarda]|uniref:Uncharacterized protein n=1 Tax=Bombardia bombarda TaxID=252184 RepID=A0AA39WMJ7_9PEZI|nr:hypothetical protein B0T17DRAFT_495230 [Bombardia bombarda]
MARTYRIFHRMWRVKKPLYWGMIPELAGVVAMLVLFGVQQPDLYRTLFWRIGFENGLNSNPNMILYAYANHRALPTIPFVWSQTITNFNVAISIVSLFVLLAKMIGTIMKIYYPIIGVVLNTALIGLYAASVYGQAGPDYADARYPSPVAWYLRKSCDIAKPYNAVNNCYMAKGTFAVTVFMVALYLFNLAIAIWSMLPNPELDMADSDEEDDHVRSTTPTGPTSDKQWEMQPTASGAAGPAGVPFTPRTQAFHTLDRKLPLRYAS